LFNNKLVHKDRDIESLNILRGLLATGILAYHLYWLPVGFGQAIMEGFFALSGFLVTKSLFSSRPDNQWNINIQDACWFWFRRIKRLGLALWIFILISMLVCALMPGKWISGWGLVVGLSSPIWISNIATIHANSSVEPFGGLWSLAIEEQFYLILPLLILFMSKIFKLNVEKRTIIVPLSLICLISLAFRISALVTSVPIAFEAYSAQYRMLGFSMGCIGYCLLRTEGTIKHWLKSGGEFIGYVLPLLIFITFCGLAFTVDSYSNKTFLIQWLIAPILTTVMCMVLFTYDPKSSGSSKKITAGFAYIGKTSYSMYLYHPLVIYLLSVKKMSGALLAFVISLILGVVSYELVEKRLNKMIFRRQNFYFVLKLLKREKEVIT